MPKIKEIERTPNPDAMRFVFGRATHKWCNTII